MPAYNRCVHEFILDFCRPTINRLQTVNGDTANTFVITLKDKGKAVTLDAALHKIIAVFTRADGEVYTQDASTGVTFTVTGVVTIDVHSASFRTGVNNVKIQLYKRTNAGDTTYPLLLTTYEQQFQGRSQAIPDSGAPNAPSQLPMLEQLISDAQEAIDDCEDATDAANDAADAANDAADAANTAAETLNGLLENIDDEPAYGSNNLVKSGGVYQFATDLVQDLEEDHLRPYTTPLMDGVANIGGMTHQFAYEDHVHPHDTSKQNVLTFDNAPTAGSNNPVKSGGIKTAIDNAIARVGVRYITPTTLTWNSAHTVATGTLGVTRSEIDALLDAGALVVIYTDTSDSAVVMYPVQSDDMLYFSSLIDNGGYYAAEIYDNTITIQFRRIAEILADKLPLMLHIDSTEEVTGGSGQTYRIVHLDPDDVALLYAQRYTREFQMQLPAWDTIEGTTLDIFLRKVHVRTTGTVCEIGFSGGMMARYSDSVEEITPSGFDEYVVNVYYVDGVLHSCTASHIKKVF